MGKEEDPFLVGHPLNLENARVEMVMPAFPALLAQPPFYKLGDEGPTLRSILLDQLSNEVIFLFSPWLLLQEP